MIKILLVEDEPKTVQSLKKGLEESNYIVDVAYDGEIALQLCNQNAYHLIISDIIIPGLNGLELCRQLRQKGIETPILMLTALSSTDDKIIGFDAGADDYLAKPFDFKEFLARVRALLKRYGHSFQIENQPSNLLKYADIEMDISSHTVHRGGLAINLTAKEFQLLEYFLRNQEKVVSKTEIAEKIWEVEDDQSFNLIEVYVNYLRKKIDKNFDKKLIHTQFGLGYILRE